MMFAFPKQQQKSCCVLEHARAASLLPLFLCTTRACFHPLLDVKEGFPMYLRSLETITISLRRREGKNSTSLMLFLLSLDFGSVFGREDDVGRVHGLLPIHNLDLGRAQKASFCWCALDKAARASVTISFSSNFRGAFLLITLE